MIACMYVNIAKGVKVVNVEGKWMVVKSIAAEKVLSYSACYLRPVSSLKVDKGREFYNNFFKK